MTGTKVARGALLQERGLQQGQASAAPGLLRLAEDGEGAAVPSLGFSGFTLWL
ncbi:hypothetical protein GA0115239_101033 [Streptomyces sp. BpilaLS-43]|nr:hypothetical protein GA0115239_101033 [Streptomyces sp. BpilaLS-43]